MMHLKQTLNRVFLGSLATDPPFTNNPFLKIEPHAVRTVHTLIHILSTVLRVFQQATRHSILRPTSSIFSLHLISTSLANQICAGELFSFGKMKGDPTQKLIINKTPWVTKTSTSSDPTIMVILDPLPFDVLPETVSILSTSKNISRYIHTASRKDYEIKASTNYVSSREIQIFQQIHRFKAFVRKQIPYLGLPYITGSL
jgi:hypothetical protein